MVDVRLFNESTHERKLREARDKVNSKFYFSGTDCISLDEMIKKVVDETASERKKVLEGKGDNYYANALDQYRGTLESSFISNKCRDKIEKLRIEETAKLITKQAIKQEQNVLGKSDKEQFIYLGLGALVVGVGLILILRR